MEILITNLSSRATSSQRVLLSAAGGQSGAHSYLVLRLLSPLHSKTLCLFKQKEQQQKKRERERYVWCSFFICNWLYKIML